MLHAACYLGLFSTVYMTGVVWFAQCVHYPLLDRGDAETFPAFAAEYQRRTSWVVFPVLAVEIFSAVALLVMWPSAQTWIGFALLVGIWGLTVCFQIPQHLSLKKGYDQVTHRALVRMNLPRAILWTVRSMVLVWTTASLSTAIPH